MKSNFIGIHEIGELEIVGGEVEITDPCYSPGDGIVIKNVRNGKYLCFTEIIDAGSWGGRNAVLYVFNEEALKTLTAGPEHFNMMNWEPQSEYFGVDSGQGGLFVSSKYKGGEDDEFYDACCDLTLEGIGAGTLENGVVSSSGYGDGGYGYETLSAGQEFVAFKIIFIGDEDNEEEESEND